MEGLAAFAVAHLHCVESVDAAPPLVAAWGPHLPRALPRRCQHFVVPFRIGLRSNCRSILLPSTRYVQRASASVQDEAIVEEGEAPFLEEVEGQSDEALEEGPKVKVKFILQKECHFGQRFFVVGDHKCLGTWNVETAVPMDWSDGHIWSAEVDFPAGARVEYKFVLSGQHEEVDWQPGPNRCFETEEELTPLVVSEAWDFVDEAAVDAAPGSSVPLEEPENEGIVSASGVETLGNGASIAGVGDASKEEESSEIAAQIDKGNGISTEVPMAELDVAVTAVEAALGIGKNGAESSKVN